MALQDILQAITAEADRQISTARASHQQTLSDMRDASAAAVMKKRKDIAEQKEQKIAQMRRKAESHVELSVRNAALRAKHDLLDRVYDDVVTQLCSVDDKTLEPVFRHLLASIKGKGELHPTKKHADLLKRLASSEQFSIGSVVEGKGGFRFVSPKHEYDYRFESLVNELLRPQTELHVIHQLFDSSATA